MAAPLYYFPGAVAPVSNPSKIPPECNLGSVLDGASFAYVQVFQGPEGTAGYCIAVNPPKGGKGTPAKCGYYPDSQRWAKVLGPDGKPTHWIGWMKDSPPGPADLQRPKMVEGYLVRLADDRDWIILAVHVPLTSLPQVFRADPAGEVILSVPEIYDDICKAGEKWYERVTQDKPFTQLEFFDFACNLLAINYRLGRREILELGLIDRTQACIKGVLYNALGIEAFLAESAAQKKTDTPPDGCEAPPGAAD